MQPRRHWPLLLALCAAVLWIFPSEPVTAQREPRPYRSRIKVPPPSERGEWGGTWFYVSRDARFALWFRDDEDGLPEVKLQYFGMQNAETFITDWKGQADYFYRDVPGAFALSLTERDANLIKGNWSWVLDLGSSARTERASVELHRTGDGRRLVLVFDSLDLVVRRGTEVRHTNDRLAYTFAKVSKRLVRWEELPF